MAGINITVMEYTLNNFYRTRWVEDENAYRKYRVFQSLTEDTIVFSVTNEYGCVAYKYYHGLDVARKTADPQRVVGFLDMVCGELLQNLEDYMFYWYIGTPVEEQQWRLQWGQQWGRQGKEQKWKTTK